MDVVGIQELSRRTGDVVEEVERGGRPALVTRNGKPVAVLFPLDEDALEDFILENAPEFVASIADGEADLRAGRVRRWRGGGE
jgi:prevent-host-death family protein